MKHLNISEINRYSRQLMLEDVGLDGQMKIKEAKVLVVGAGGLGCPVLQYLNAAGIGTLGIVDFDRVEIHNLHRQILYDTADLGKPKALTAMHKLQQSNPHVVYQVWDELLEESNAAGIIAQFDVVVDGSDNFLTRYLVNDVCVSLGKPLVYGSILGSEGQLAVFNYKGGKHLRDLFPEPPDPADVPSCSENGVLGVVPGIIGSMMCDLVLKVVLGKNVPADKLFLFDLNGYSLSFINYSSDENTYL